MKSFIVTFFIGTFSLKAYFLYIIGEVQFNFECKVIHNQVHAFGIEYKFQRSVMTYNLNT